MSITLKYLKSCHRGREGRFVLSCSRAELELIWMQILYHRMKLSSEGGGARKAVGFPPLLGNQADTVRSSVRRAKATPLQADLEILCHSMQRCPSSAHTQACVNPGSGKRVLSIFPSSPLAAPVTGVSEVRATQERRYAVQRWFRRLLLPLRRGAKERLSCPPKMQTYLDLV